MDSSSYICVVSLVPFSCKDVFFISQEEQVIFVIFKNILQSMKENLQQGWK